MTKITLDEEAGTAAVYGGSVLGGGGGGTIENGLISSKLAVSMGRPTLMKIEDLNDGDLVVTASAVGAPAAKDRFFLPIDGNKAMELVQQKFDRPIAGIITNENGPNSGVNGWLQSASLKIPMIDAPANGRAHPTGLMGAMGINRLEGYRSIQSAVGGNPDKERYVEMLVEGNLRTNANLVRQAAVEAGGYVKVVRDPMPASYIRENAAPGATSQAIKIGRAMMKAMEEGPEAVIKAIVETTGGEIYCQGKVEQLSLETVGGYDVGNLFVTGDKKVELSIWNEFLTLDSDGKRRASFPDLITVISMETGIPLPSAKVRNGDEVAVLVVPRDNLILGKGALLPEAIEEAENAIKRKLS